MTVDGPEAGRKLIAAITAQIESLPEFCEKLKDLVHVALQQRTDSRIERLVALQRQEDAIARQIDHIIAFVRNGVGSPSLGEELTKLERQRSDLAARRQDILDEPVAMPVLPSIDDVKLLARSALANQADEPYEFGRIMRRLIPQIIVRPFRLCDGGGIVLRASLTLNLAGLLPTSQRQPDVAAHLQRELVVDLFDPPQRAAFREQVVALRNAGLTENDVAPAGDYQNRGAACYGVRSPDATTGLERPVRSRNRTDGGHGKTAAATNTRATSSVPLPIRASDRSLKLSIPKPKASHQCGAGPFFISNHQGKKTFGQYDQSRAAPERRRTLSRVRSVATAAAIVDTVRRA